MAVLAFRGFNYSSECRLIEKDVLSSRNVIVNLTGFFRMRHKGFLTLILLALLSGHGVHPALAGGKTYQGKEESAHCALWSTERLKWPQTILGREKAECRRRAVDSSASNTQCRLLRTYIDADSGERICIYKRHGTGLEELTLSMSAFLKCQTDFMCRRTAK